MPLGSAGQARGRVSPAGKDRGWGGWRGNKLPGKVLWFWGLCISPEGEEDVCT